MLFTLATILIYLGLKNGNLIWSDYQVVLTIIFVLSILEIFAEIWWVFKQLIKLIKTKIIPFYYKKKFKHIMKKKDKGQILTPKEIKLLEFIKNKQENNQKDDSKKLKKKK